MPNDSAVRLIQPVAIEVQLTEVPQNGARALFAKAVEAEVVPKKAAPQAATAAA